MGWISQVLLCTFITTVMQVELAIGLVVFPVLSHLRVWVLVSCVTCHFKHIYMSFVCLVLLWCCWYNTSLMRICWYVYVIQFIFIFLDNKHYLWSHAQCSVAKCIWSFQFQSSKGCFCKISVLAYIAIVSSSFAI